MLNVTSLIDVMFLLLIFLLVTSSFRRQPAVTVVLPRSATAEEAVDTPAILYLTGDGRVFLDERAVTEADLPPLLAQMKSDTGEDRMVLRADAAAQHGDVVRLLDVIKQSGFTRISLSARSAGGE
ncbi:biopolymer transporter ExbD [bacterium]|nr:biopolymer transporter ExbD [bacterium]